MLQVVDSMPIRDEAPDVVRIARCLEGRVACAWSSILRFDFGRVVPWVRRGDDGGLTAIAGPDAVHLIPGRPTRGERPHDRRRSSSSTRATRCRSCSPGTRRTSRSRRPSTASPRPRTRRAWWEEWTARAQVDGRVRATLVQRSLITLKALTYAPTGGIVAAPTTSLPEAIGGVRNWDYRFCWLRDATLTLQSLMHAGYIDEARAWRDWLLRAVAGSPGELQIMYGPAGERRLPELELAVAARLRGLGARCGSATPPPTSSSSTSTAS